MKKKSIYTIIVIGIYIIIALGSQGDPPLGHEYIEKNIEQSTDENINIEDNSSKRTVKLTPKTLKLDKKQAIKDREKIFCFHKPWKKHTILPFFMFLWIVWEVIVIKYRKYNKDKNQNQYFSNVRKHLHAYAIGSFGAFIFLFVIILYLAEPLLIYFVYLIPIIPALFFHIQYLKKEKFNGLLFVFNLLFIIETFVISYKILSIDNLRPLNYLLTQLVFLFAVENIAISLNNIYEKYKMKPNYFLLRLFTIAILSIVNFIGYTYSLKNSYPWVENESFNPNSITVRTEIDSVAYYNNKGVDLHKSNNLL